MAGVRVLLGACMVGVALFLNGCGGGGSTPAPGPSIKTTVIVMRHCYRSTGKMGIHANPKYQEYDEYAKDVWPDFSVPEFHCLPRGTEIVKQQGAWFKRNGGLPLPIRAIADDCQRDNDTMHALLKGLAYAAGDVSTSTSKSPFIWGVNTPACKAKQASTDATIKAVQAAVDASPPLDSKLLNKLYVALGEGVAGDWTGIPCKVDTSAGGWVEPNGACQAASQFAERLLMELGGGMHPLGWGHVTPSDVPALLGLHTWWFNRAYGVPEMYNREAASIAAHVSASLNKAEPGTTLYVGHDGQIAGLASALNLSWIPDPYPKNAALPGSMLRFDRDGDKVSVSYMYAKHSGDVDPTVTMHSGNAGFIGSDLSNSIDKAEFDKLLAQNTIRECADVSDIAPLKTDEVLTV